MADQAPPNDTSIDEGTVVLPPKMRVHALAKLLGLTSKQVMAKAADLGTELRSAHSSLQRDLAEQIRAALGAPAETGAEAAPEPVGEVPEVPAETAEVPAAEVPAGEPAVAAEAAVEDTTAQEPAAPPAAPTLFTGVEQETPVFTAPEPSAVEPVVSAPLFLQPEVTAPAEAAPRRRRSRRAAEAPEPSVAEEVTEETAAAEPGEEAAEEEPRRRRRGRRGRGRGRGEQAETPEETTPEETSPAETAAEEGAAPEKGEGPEAEPEEPATEEVATAEPSAEQAEGEQAEGEQAEDEQKESEQREGEEESAEGPSRRRRRRRRRKGSADGAETAVEDDSVPTVVHEREPRSKTRAAKDEVQGITGSTRLEAKRQRRRDGRDAGRRRPPILTESEFLARRESVDRVMVVREKAGDTANPGNITQVAVLEDGVLVEHFVTSAGSGSMVGNIFLGRVQNVLPSMEAAFIDIGRGRNGVLYAGEVNWEAAGLGGNSRKIEQALKPGDRVLVQVSKDPVGHKGARLTTQISLAGRFLVYVPGGSSTGISRKLPDTERKRLKEILREVVPAEAGVIIRTAAEGVSEDELARDVQRLQTQWASIEEQAAKLEADGSGQPKTLYEEPDLLVKVIRDLFNEDFSKLVIEGGNAWSTVENYIRTVAPDMLPRVERHDSESGGRDVFAAHRIDEQLAKALDRKVWLPSGGTLVIDRTEAMTVVDVNTGKFTGAGGNLEETVTRNNLEAAEEIVRQMRLRDIGGMIVVDFIDMVLESNRDLVLRRLTEALGRDRTRHQVSEVTSLGLVQMTRKRLGTGLVEAFSTTCEHCHGRGILVHSEPVEVAAAEDGGRPARGESGSRRRRGRDRGTQPEPATTEAAVSQPAPEAPVVDATVKRAHPVALAMAAHHGNHDEHPTESGAEPAEAVPTEAVPTKAVPTKAGPTTAGPTTAGPTKAAPTKAAPAETPTEAVSAEAAPTPVAEPREARPAEAPEAGTQPAEPAARRRRRVSRAAAAPTGDGTGTVFVVPTPAPEPVAVATAPAGDSAEPVTVRRPRRRRAAGRPAGPPVEAQA
ncbi:translation initiation factor IF-2 N-terminal domain-containing protein [Rhodococcus sp. CSLK01-03]|uniref:Translation initiation factor IF-2 N-terminal domain-containing protein n=1 Tax=Rhodococcus indonesiensis TaxID=3055869 RepID=A0ABT7RIP9_9NOCA|nr:translation initiation factor IF-2 N-terminal domain-containing protein [Rhodococcus indonesiensis]MDM7487523.1 translation initiation factor IF-2 N-terminal domain-containing protein [Rhodococcus indonesiensis]